MSRFRKDSEDFQETRKLSRFRFGDYGTHLPQLRSQVETADTSRRKNNSIKKEEEP
jgi:hypothetical protein